MTARIGILGAGSWGTALAVLQAHNGHAVTLWEFQPNVAETLKCKRENSDFLPGVKIPDAIAITSDLTLAVENQDLILLVIPSHVVRSVAQQMAPHNLGDAIVVSCAKGIENKTLLCMSNVLDAVIPSLSKERITALSGPSHAEEVGRLIPTVVTVGSASLNAARITQEILRSPVFRVYASDDIIGVELGGALKNVIAVAAGISDGVGFGDNTKAALMTRGLVEITRLGTALGANSLTFAGLSGMGDLMVTCMSRHSRNRYLGEQIGQGRSLEDVLAGMVQVAEGVRTTQSVADLSARHGVEMPISAEVNQVLFEGKPPKEAVRDLMTRDSKVEDWG